MSIQKSTKKAVPDWVEMGRKAALVYEILGAPFESDCACRTCELIRENIDFLESIFRPPTPAPRR